MTEKHRNAPIDMSPAEFRSAGHALVDQVANLLEGMRDRRVTAGLSPTKVRSLIDGDAKMPEQGASPQQLLTDAAATLMQNSLYNGHPKFLGYVTSSPAPIGMLADLLAASVNSNVGSYVLGPVATEIESQTVRWIAELLHYPADSSGVLVSGGNQANFVGFYTAIRDRYPRDGDRDLSKATVYASSETHTWIEKACAMFGLPKTALRLIQVDNGQRLIMSELERAVANDIANGMKPLMIVGSAGTVSTGAVDPLPAMADLCVKHKIWFHIDGAYGGFAAMLDDASADLRGLSRADSVAIDPHKWLYAPLEAGCALIRDKEKHRAAFSYHPPYYHFDEEATNYVDLGPQNSRGFRALKVWLGLKQVGRRGYQQMIGDDIALAHALYDRLEADDRFEAHTVNLSITTFRYVPDELRTTVGQAETEATLNALNKAIQGALEQSGELFVSNAVVRGTYLLRSCVVNFRTSLGDMEEIPDIVARHGAAVFAEMQTATT